MQDGPSQAETQESMLQRVEHDGREFAQGAAERQDSDGTYTRHSYLQYSRYAGSARADSLHVLSSERLCLMAEADACSVLKLRVLTSAPAGQRAGQPNQRNPVNRASCCIH